MSLKYFFMFDPQIIHVKSENGEPINVRKNFNKHQFSVNDESSC